MISSLATQADPNKVVVIIGLAIIFIFMLVALMLVLKFVRLWIQGFFACANIKLVELIGMWLRKVDPNVIVLCKITAVQGGLKLTTQDLESHYLAGGSVPKVVRAMIAAKRNGIDLSFEDVAKRDLAGCDVLAEIQAQIRAKGGDEVFITRDTEENEKAASKKNDDLNDILGHEKSI